MVSSRGVGSTFSFHTARVYPLVERLHFSDSSLQGGADVNTLYSQYVYMWCVLSPLPDSDSI